MFTSIRKDFHEETLRTSIIGICVLYSIFHSVATVAYPDRFNIDVWLITIVIALVSGLSLMLLKCHKLILAHICWQIGLIFTITISIFLLARAEIALFYLLIPLTAFASGLRWLVIGSVILIVPVIRFLPLTDAMFPYRDWLILLLLLMALYIYLASRTFALITEWAVENYAEAQRSLEEVRTSRAELKSVLKSLDDAYRLQERLNTELISAKRSVEAMQAFKRAFVNNISHELRTPLNLILGFSEVMVNSPESYGVELPKAYRGDVYSIYRSTQHLLSLVDDVLDLSRIEARKMPLAYQETDFRCLIHEAVELIESYILSKKLTLKLDIPPDLPTMRIDPVRIRQVLLNLMINATRFTSQGWIAVEVYCQDQQVTVRVSDTGTGIAPEHLPYIFDEFHSTSYSGANWRGGTGLGLPISKSFIELHGGTIGVDETYRGGACVWFSLPCDAAAAQPQRSPKIEDRYCDRNPTQEQVVVVVHDDPQIVNFLKRYLSGCHIIRAQTVEEAQQLAFEHFAHLLLTYPGMIPVTLPPNMLVVECAMPSRDQSARALGVTDILTKPFSQRELNAVLDRLLPQVETILIVDDDPEMARLFRRMLRTRLSAGELINAHNGLEALTMMERYHPDLVLLDLQMPLMNGYEVIAYMKQRPDLAAVPIVVITGNIEDPINDPIAQTLTLSRQQAFQFTEILPILTAILNATVPPHPI